jgi:diguanylate cyclase (GGDEF)-like protein
MGRTRGHPGRRDARPAARSGAVLFLLGAGLLATVALPQPAPPPLPVAAGLATVALAGGLALLAFDRLGGASLDLVFALDLVAMLLVAVLVGLSGGGASPYAEYYLFALVHAAAFQSRGRVAAMLAFTVGLFLAPLLYGGADGAFVTLAAISIPPAIVAVVAVHSAMDVLRAQRRALERREARALAMADRDPLTGLANYRVFRRELVAAVEAGAPFTLVMLDLDGFKAVNDQLGHQAGDRLLRDVGARLHEALRSDDVLCRPGGDEFVVIAARAGPEKAPELARRLAGAVERAGGERVSATAGWANYPRDATTAAGLVERADAAMRAAKRPGDRAAA